MSKTNQFEDDLLELIMENVDLTNIGDAGGLLGSVADGSVYIALFTADPGEASSFANEATYGAYARQIVGRGAANWTTASGTCDNDNAITFVQCSSGSNTITHFAICKSLSGTTAQDMMVKGALTTSVVISTNITPEFAAGELNYSED